MGQYKTLMNARNAVRRSNRHVAKWPPTTQAGVRGKATRTQAGRKAK